jgi:malonyl-CoA decarboxylase
MKQMHCIQYILNLVLCLLQKEAPTSLTEDQPYLSAMNTCLLNLLRLWFSVGFLQLERITWKSPTDMLEKVGGSSP